MGRGSATIARVRARVENTASRASDTLAASRRRYRTVDTAFHTYDRDKRAVGNVLAGAVAFRLFVYLLPLALALLTLVGIIAGFNPNTPKELVQNSGLGKTVVDSVASATSASKKGLWALIPLSLYALYSGGSGVIKVLRAIHAVAWGEPLKRMKRGWAAAFALGGVALVLLAVVLLLQWIRKESGGLGLTATVLTVLVYSGAWLLASYTLPHGDAPWQALIPGAILVGVGVEALHLVSVYYLGSKINSASEMYGSLGAAATIIAWLYLVGRLFVASAMLNATVWERRRPGKGNHPPGAQHHFGPVLTLGGDEGGSALVRNPLTGEDGNARSQPGRS